MTNLSTGDMLRGALAEGTDLGKQAKTIMDAGGLVERITGRFSCAKCGAGFHEKFHPPQTDGICDQCDSTDFSRRSDDNVDAVKTRLKAYHAQTAPLMPFYEERGLLVSIDGMADMDRVTQSIFDALTARAGVSGWKASLEKVLCFPL